MFYRKELAIVSNLRFISRTNFILGYTEHERSFITSGPSVSGPFRCCRLSNITSMIKKTVCRRKLILYFLISVDCIYALIV